MLLTAVSTAAPATTVCTAPQSEEISFLACISACQGLRGCRRLRYLGEIGIFKADGRFTMMSESSDTRGRLYNGDAVSQSGDYCMDAGPCL